MMAATSSELNFLRFHKLVLEPLTRRSAGDPFVHDPRREMATAAGMIALNFASLGVMWGYFSSDLANQWNKRYSVHGSEFSVSLAARAVMESVGTLFDISANGTSFVIQTPPEIGSLDKLSDHTRVSIDRTCKLYEQTLPNDMYLTLGAALNFNDELQWSSATGQALQSYESAVDNYPHLMTDPEHLSSRLVPWWFFAGAPYLEEARVNAADSILGGLNEFLENSGGLTRAGLAGGLPSEESRGTPNDQTLTPLEVDTALVLAQPLLRVPSLDLRATPTIGDNVRRPPKDASRQFEDPDPIGTLPAVINFPIEATGTAASRVPEIEVGAARLGSLLKSQALEQLGLMSNQNSQSTPVEAGVEEGQVGGSVDAESASQRGH